LDNSHSAAFRKKLPRPSIVSFSVISRGSKISGPSLTVGSSGITADTTGSETCSAIGEGGKAGSGIFGSVAGGAGGAMASGSGGGEGALVGSGRIMGCSKIGAGFSSISGTSDLVSLN
jgi:hypothetical protein